MLQEQMTLCSEMLFVGLMIFETVVAYPPVLR